MFISTRRSCLVSSIVLDMIGWTTVNLENLLMQVRKYFLSVEKMSKCSIE